MYIPKMAIVLMILLPAIGCSYKQPHIGSYSQAIEQASIDEEDRLELMDCVSKWSVHASVRKTITSYVTSKGFFDSQRYIAVEAGSAGWGGYGYVYLWKGKDGTNLVTNMADGRQDIPYEACLDGQSLESLMAMIDSDVPLTGRINKQVADGPCYFLTIRKDAYINQFAVYSPRVGEHLHVSENIINGILRLMSRQAR